MRCLCMWQGKFHVMLCMCCGGVSTCCCVLQERLGMMGEEERAAGYGVSVKELKNLMEARGRESYDKIQAEYGGVLELCKRLKTSPTQGRCFHSCRLRPSHLCAIGEISDI